MKAITVHIRETEKGDKDLTLQNLREEIVGFMYRQTVSKSTKADMQFYVLLFFASVTIGKKSALESILDEGIPKFEQFTSALGSRQGYLRRNEYAEIKTQHGLDQLFYKDLFFVISDGLININQIESRFQDVISQDKNIQEVFSRLKSDYQPRVEPLIKQFSGSRIEDTRTDENGNVHDLSKSVYRTVYMRSSRNLELNLQKYTSVKKIESNSPIDFTFLQYVDPNVLMHLWDKYDLAHYMVDTVKVVGKVANSSLGSGLIGAYVGAYLNNRRVNGAENRKAKNDTKIELEIARAKHQNAIDELNAKLVQSVLDSNKALRSEVRRLKQEQLAEANKSKAVRNEDLLKSLSQRVTRLEKLEISTEVTEADGTQQSLM